MTDKEALKLAHGYLDRLIRGLNMDDTSEAVQVRDAIKQALAAPVEPLEYWNAVEGWVKIDEVREHFDSVGCGTIYKTAGDGRVPLTAAQRQWVGLTDNEIDNTYETQVWDARRSYARAIEAKLKEKNA
jgi:hypothetical protein